MGWEEGRGEICRKICWMGREEKQEKKGKRPLKLMGTPRVMDTYARKSASNLEHK